MAERGAPVGNNNAAKGQRWREAIERALAKRSRAKGIEALDELAEKFLDSIVIEGVTGYRELGDRLDGKAMQPIQADVDGSLTVTVKQFTLDKP